MLPDMWYATLNLMCFLPYFVIEVGIISFLLCLTKPLTRPEQSYGGTVSLGQHTGDLLSGPTEEL